MYGAVSLAELQMRTHAAGCPRLVLLLTVEEVGVGDTPFSLLGFHRRGGSGIVHLI